MTDTYSSPAPPTDEITAAPAEGTTPASPVAVLRRSNRQRLVAGVAGGVGERFDVDPNIVRVAFVVLASLWGFGVAVYLALWAFIPKSTEPAPEKVELDDSPTRLSRWARAGLLLGVIAVAAIFGSTIGRVPHWGRGVVLLWLAYLVGLALISFGSPARRVTLRRIVAATFLAGLTAIILVVGGVLIFLSSTGVSFDGGSGYRAWQPQSLTDVQSTYRVEFGQSVIDLRSVVFPTSGYTITASVTVGDLRILLPAGTKVNLRTHVGAGSVNYGFVDGPRHALAPTGGARLTINATVGIGRIEVDRAAPPQTAVGPRPPAPPTLAPCAGTSPPCGGLNPPPLPSK